MTPPDLAAELLQLWRTAYEQPVPDGWDFSEFAGRIEQSEPPWSYESLAREAVAGTDSAVDLGTGGGEVLLTLADVLPADTNASEGWSPPVRAEMSTAVTDELSLERS